MWPNEAVQEPDTASFPSSWLLGVVQASLDYCSIGYHDALESRARVSHQPLRGPSLRSLRARSQQCAMPKMLGPDRVAVRRL